MDTKTHPQRVSEGAQAHPASFWGAETARIAAREAESAEHAEMDELYARALAATS